MQARYKTIVGTAFTVAVLAFFAVYLWRHWRSDSLPDLAGSWPWIAASLPGMIGLVLVMAWMWHALLKALGARPPLFPDTLWVHIIAWLGRYVPGKIALFAGKMLLGERLGAPRAVLASSLVYESALFLLSGFSVVLLTLGPLAVSELAGLGQPPAWLPALAVLVVASTLFALPAGLRRIGALFPAFRAAGVAPSAGRLAAILAGYHLAHLSAGLGFYLLLGAILPQHGLTVWQAVGVLTAAHIGGIMAVFAPAGLGVRESVMTLLLAPIVGLEPAVSASILARLWSLAADALLLLFLPLVWLKRPA